MASGRHSANAAARPRRSKTVWPWVFGILLLVTILLVLAFTLGWIDVGATEDPPGT